MKNIVIVGAPETPAEYWGVMEESPRGVREIRGRLDMTKEEAENMVRALQLSAYSLGLTETYYHLHRLRGR